MTNPSLDTSHGVNSMPTRMKALLFLNGLGLFVVGIFFGWTWFFHLLKEIVLFPLPIQIEVEIPGDSRAFRMGHMEAITQALLLMGLAFGGQFMDLSKHLFSWLFWTALVTAWLFTLPAMANTFYGTRGLAFGGGPFKPSLANDVIYFFGWPPVVCVHLLFGIAIYGVWRYLKTTQNEV
jgi:CRISPR-associated DxTHG motif protein